MMDVAPAPSPLVVGVVGAGTMGTGIAAVLAVAGHRVVVHESDASARAHARSQADAIIAEIGGIGDIVWPDNLEGLADASLVIEAAPEDLALKHALYERLFAIVGSEATVASNTSSLMPDRLSAEMSDEQAGRFLVAHFWNPPHLLPLVELVPGQRTAPTTTVRLRDALAAARLRPVILDRAVPGFVGNRLQFAMLREALALVEQGVATPEVVDEVVRFSLGRRYAATGPIESADLGGLHVFLAVARELMPGLAAADEGTSMLAELVEQGRTGARSGSGFYDWTDARKEEAARRRRFLLRNRSELD